MKKIRFYIFAALILLSACPQVPPELLSDPGITVSYDYDVTPDATVSNKRVVVYIPYWSFDYAINNTLDLDKVTHVNLAFVNPDSNADFSFPQVSNDKIQNLVSTARAKGVKVLMSIGGAGTTEKYDDWLAADNVQALVNRMVNCMLTYKLDGIDVDLESARITENYNNFIETIYNTLPDEDMLLTAAVQEYTGNRISDASLTYFDFISPMAYDMTGPWNPGGQHSSYQYAKQNLDYWVISRGVPASKVCLGVPFYGYDFSKPDDQMYTAYKDIIASNPATYSPYDVKDQIYYNGMNTIETKSLLAKNYGGIMVWEISQDAGAPYSLLDVIYSTLNN